MWGRGFQQRSTEELLKLEVRPGPPGEPPKRPRAWLGVAGVLGLILGAVLLTTFSDRSGQDDAEAEPTDGHSLDSAP